jgi:hypothetical protein
MAPQEQEHSHHGEAIQVEEENTNTNRAAPGVSYFTPLQDPRAGTALRLKDGGDKLPKLFTPIKLRGLELQNRVVVSVVRFETFFRTILIGCLYSCRLFASTLLRMAT